MNKKSKATALIPFAVLPYDTIAGRAGYWVPVSQLSFLEGSDQDASLVHEVRNLLDLPAQSVAIPL